jgi:Alpha-L-arabinofuranosidase B (ABFB) domain
MFLSLRSRNFGDRFIRHQNFLGELTPIVSDLDRRDATFFVQELAGGKMRLVATNLDRTFVLRHQDWPAPGSEDTELGVLMELEVGHGETEVYAGVQA